ncbi:aminopeptidase P family protein [Alsobacter sp. SYSU M60028]|uniref:Aminopeptidase P family protein n=1 Tax=Alsobacter ponti TaxID=2962936 RepID=A0ABT1L8C3_9HYPH|nr:aminopeptidase P family protein [Alsobacter ponti]MCP8937191.1 aminopeptidase P family protein [Alsobacter ponti]
MSVKKTARFQSFESRSDRSQGAARAARLRAELARRGLDGFIVPRTDEHQNEYVPPHAERLAWLTGFTGSWGVAIVLRDEAAIFVDGRYTVQVREQVDTDVFTPEHLIETPPEAWLEKHLKPGMNLGYDPALKTPDAVKRYEKAAARAGASLAPVDGNPVDAIWEDRPAPPLGAVALHPAELAGEDVAAKLDRIRAKLAGLGADALVISDPHAVAWTFNIRGADVSHTPLPLGYAVTPREGRPRLFIDGRKLSNAVRDALASVADIEEPSALDATLRELGAAKSSVRFDQATASHRLVSLVVEAGGSADIGVDPVALMKAAKNAAEIAGSRSAHLRDAAAMANFLAWLAREAPKGVVTEVSAAVHLEECRHATGALRDISFPSISGAGPNAAIPHYRVSHETDRVLEPGIYLIDSGAQYQDGTTDITRTVAIGEPTAEMRDRFTRVLRGHIGIARAVFPKGTSGAQIDSFARKPLWEAGLDFDHGTGHGIGSYLSVHEGPQRIAKTGVTPLELGMLLSNEPGYYKAGHWGIRIENLILVERREIPGAEREMYGFETLTFAPIDLALVEPSLMNAEEIAWLDDYHARVRELVAPQVEGETLAWLEGATRPIGR